MSYAASSPNARNAYVPPGGTSAIQVGNATYHFLQFPLTFSTWQFIGVAFIIFILARHWGKFVNDIT